MLLIVCACPALVVLIVAPAQRHRRMHDEVKAVASSQRLSVLVAQQIGTALGMLASKAQYMAATGPDAKALGGGTTAAQQRNIALANALQEVHRSMLQLQQKLPDKAHASMR